MANEGGRRQSNLGRRVRRHIERAAETWIQTRLIAGLVLLAAVLSIVATSDLTKAGGRAAVRAGIVGQERIAPAGSDCGAHLNDSRPGPLHARVR